MNDPVAELDELLPNLPASVASARLGEEAQRLATGFNDVVRQKQRLMALADVGALLNARKDSPARVAVTKSLDAANEAGLAMAEASDAEGLRIAAEEYKAFVQSLNGLDAVLRPLWRTVVERDFRPLASVGVMMAGLPSASGLGTRMQQAAAEAVASAEANRPAEELVAAIRRLVDRRIALVDEQKKLAGHPEVDTFLLALTSHRATLDLLTPVVLTWLRQQNALAVLKVTAA